MKLLAIETSENGCSAALWIDGKTTEHFELVPRRHSELLLPMVDAVLADAAVSRSQLDAIAFSRGPGSFTGIRIATGVAQGLGYALDCPLVPVSTLAGIAQGCYRRTRNRQVAVAMDARMQEVYWGAYHLGPEDVMTLAGEERCCAPSAVALQGNGWCRSGSGWDVYATELEAACDAQLISSDSDACCHAQDIAVLAVAEIAAGGGVSADMALPVYLRNEVAKARAKA